MSASMSRGTVVVSNEVEVKNATGDPIPVSGTVDTGAGTFAYDAGTAAATVDVPTGAKLRRVYVVAGEFVGATVTIGGGDTITLPPGGEFNEDISGAATGADVVIGGTIDSYYVSWTT